MFHHNFTIEVPFDGRENCFLKLLNRNKNMMQYANELIIAAAIAPYFGTSSASKRTTSTFFVR